MILRFSCDDGFKDDLKVARMLENYGFKGIFYMAPDQCTLNPFEILKISQKHEIGGHTLTHQRLTECDLETAEKEIEYGKKKLERIVGKTITKFAYPRGWYNEDVKRLVMQAGFEEARSMKMGIIDVEGYDVYELPASAHIYPRPEYEEKGIVKSICDLFDEAKRNDGYFNLCFHGWEINKFKIWEDFDKILIHICNEIKDTRITEI